MESRGLSECPEAQTWGNLHSSDSCVVILAPHCHKLKYFTVLVLILCLQKRGESSLPLKLRN